MAQSSILGGNPTPARPRGTDTDLLGPSDSSDTGSDVQGERRLATTADDGGTGAIPVDLDSDTDSTGTGERASAEGNDAREGADILPDRVIRPSAAADDDLSLDDPEAADIEDLELDDSESPEGGDAEEDPAPERHSGSGNQDVGSGRNSGPSTPRERSQR